MRTQYSGAPKNITDDNTHALFLSYNFTPKLLIAWLNCEASFGTAALLFHVAYFTVTDLILFPASSRAPSATSFVTGSTNYGFIVAPRRGRHAALIIAYTGCVIQLEISWRYFKTGELASCQFGGRCELAGLETMPRENYFRRLQGHTQKKTKP